MKIFTSLFILILASQLMFGQSMILNMVYEPAEPTTKDTILVITEYQFPSSPCLIDSKGATPVGFEIQAFSHYCLGPLTALCNTKDTFKINPLPEGDYTFLLSLSSGMGNVPCSPGIVIDDMDTLKFSVSVFSGVGEQQENVFFVYPNPATSQLNFSSPVNGLSKIFNISGTEIKSIMPNTKQINVISFPPGIYLLESEGKYYRWIKL